MTDWRGMHDSEYIGAWDLPEKGVVVVIAGVKSGELTGTGGKKARKPIVSFRGKQKGMAFNKTNCRIVAGMYGNNTRDWVGKAIAIYPTQTSFGNATVDCIRVKPMVPQAPNNTRGGKQPEAVEEPEEELDDAVEPEETDEERAARIDRGEA